MGLEIKNGITEYLWKFKNFGQILGFFFAQTFVCYDISISDFIDPQYLFSWINGLDIKVTFQV